MAANDFNVRSSKTSPAYLHSNSTSHTWIFSAIAELIDNAYDPDAGSTELSIDKYVVQKTTCLTFTDNGSGMSPDQLHRMLSFGYSDKTEVAGHKPIGRYGNGFKSGSMRIGKDVVVFTKSDQSTSVGFLSQTYLEAIQADTVLVPIVTFDFRTREPMPTSDNSLDHILTHSIFKSIDAIFDEINKLDDFDTGTRIVIYNLKKGEDGMPELDFVTDSRDIINSEYHNFRTHHEIGQKTTSRESNESVPKYKRSLREYCSIMFLKPRMKITLRKEKVKCRLITKSLRLTEQDIYRPKFLTEPVKIIWGFGSPNEDCGLMLYNRNRLIKAYAKVGWQKQQNEKGMNVIGVVEVDFLDPIHNKQDFNKTDQYNACMSSLGSKLNEYWQAKTGSEETNLNELVSLPTDCTWAQCDRCNKWRKLPDGTRPEDLPDRWMCHMNGDRTHNRCDVDEELEDETLGRGRSFVKKSKKSKKADKKGTQVEPSITSEVVENEPKSKNQGLDLLVQVPSLDSERRRNSDEHSPPKKLHFTDDVKSASRDQNLTKTSGIYSHDESPTPPKCTSPDPNMIYSGPAAGSETISPMEALKHKTTSGFDKGVRSSNIESNYFHTSDGSDTWLGKHLQLNNSNYSSLDLTHGQRPASMGSVISTTITDKMPPDNSCTNVNNIPVVSKVEIQTECSVLPCKRDVEVRNGIQNIKVEPDNSQMSLKPKQTGFHATPTTSDVRIQTFVKQVSSVSSQTDVTLDRLTRGVGIQTDKFEGPIKSDGGLNQSLIRLQEVGIQTREVSNLDGIHLRKLRKSVIQLLRKMYPSRTEMWKIPLENVDDQVRVALNLHNGDRDLEAKVCPGNDTPTEKQKADEPETCFMAEDVISDINESFEESELKKLSNAANKSNRKRKLSVSTTSDTPVVLPKTIHQSTLAHNSVVPDMENNISALETIDTKSNQLPAEKGKWRNSTNIPSRSLTSVKPVSNEKETTSMIFKGKQPSMALGTSHEVSGLPSFRNASPSGTEELDTATPGSRKSSVMTQSVRTELKSVSDLASYSNAKSGMQSGSNRRKEEPKTSTGIEEPGSRTRVVGQPQDSGSTSSGKSKCLIS